MSVVAKLDTRVLDAIIAQHRQEAGVIVRGAAFSVEGESKVRAPVDTGALKNSLNTSEVNDLNYRVSDGVEYGIYQELGTSKMRAQPFMVPAVEAVRKPWLDNWRAFFKRWA